MCHNVCNNRRPNNCECGCEPDNFEPVITQRYNCGRTQQVIRHRHVVNHQHDIINEYDIIHEHDYNYYDIVRERNEVKHNDYTNHECNYCDRNDRNDRNENENCQRRCG